MKKLLFLLLSALACQSMLAMEQAEQLDLSQEEKDQDQAVFRLAISSGNIQGVKELIEAGADIYNRQSPLEESCLTSCGGRYQITNMNVIRKKPGMVQACFLKSFDVAQLLLETAMRLKNDEINSVKNWLLLTKKLKTEKGIVILKDIRQFIAQHICKLLAQGLHDRVIRAGASETLELVKYLNQQEIPAINLGLPDDQDKRVAATLLEQLLLKHIDINFLNEFVHKLTLLPIKK